MRCRTSASSDLMNHFLGLLQWGKGNDHSRHCWLAAASSWKRSSWIRIILNLNYMFDKLLDKKLLITNSKFFIPRLLHYFKYRLVDLRGEAQRLYTHRSVLGAAKRWRTSTFCCLHRECVSFEFWYGMCSFFCARARMTLLNSLSERLMLLVSSVRVLVFGNSLPARSTKFMKPTSFSGRFTTDSIVGFPLLQSCHGFHLRLNSARRMRWRYWCLPP